MKKLLLLLFLASLCTGVHSQEQQIKIINFQVKNILPSKIDDWNKVPAALILTSQKLPTVQLKEPKLVIQIKSNGAIICGNNPSYAGTIGSFDVKTFTTNELTGMLGNCPALKDGNYQICVQFFNLDRIAISNELCKDFKVETAKVEDFAPPTLITPENGKSINKKELLKPIMFRWTPLVPKPKEPVTYRLKIWQLMQGQSGVQAMKSNAPLVTKDVQNITQAMVSNLEIGPCKPPYLCDFIWQVQALTKEEKPIGRNNGNSETYSFKILDDNINTKIDSIDISCCINGKQNIYIKVNNQHLTNPAQVTAIKYRVNGTGPLTTLTPTVPLLPNTIAANSSQVFTASINCVDSMKTIKFIVDAIWPTDPDNINNETAWDTLHCVCTDCDEKYFMLNAPVPSQINFSNNILSFNQPVSITTSPAKTIKSIQADLVYFEMVPENDFCIPCNKDASTYGHFTNGSNSIQWNGPQQTLNFNITTPQLTPCCSAVFRYCIRYKIEFTDCTSCNKLVCYEKKKEGCSKTGTGNDNQNNPK
ncbi:MAG: hypothetical protein ACOYLO_10515 [Ferruginibacter sp.]